MDPLDRHRPPVAILTTYYHPVVGGVETMAAQLVRHLVRRGHRVHVLTRRTSRRDPVRERLDGADVLRLPPTGPRRGYGKWVVLPAMVAALWRLRRDISVICCVDFRGIGIAGLIGSALLGLPVLFDAETDGVLAGRSVRLRLARLGVSPDGAVARAVTWPIRATYRHADWYVCPSRAIEREFVAAGVPASRLTCVPHAVDTAVFTPVSGDVRREERRRLGLPEHDTVAVFVGRLSLEKGVLDLIDAWAAAALDHASLVIVGPDMPGHPWDAGPALRARIAELGLESRVRLAGGVDRRDVTRWLQAADFAVQPSHFEAFGLAAAEAMAAGLPVIASDVGGLRDYVQPDVNGLRVPPRRVDALSHAIRLLALDPRLRARLAAGARRTAGRFEERVVMERFARLLDDLAAPQAAAVATIAR